MISSFIIPQKFFRYKVKIESIFGKTERLRAFDLFLEKATAHATPKKAKCRAVHLAVFFVWGGRWKIAERSGQLIDFYNVAGYVAAEIPPHIVAA